MLAAQFTALVNQRPAATSPNPADAPGAGSKGSYHSFYFFPYYQKDFRNGHIRTGAEMQLTLFDAASETKAFGYRIPVAICFAF